MDRHGHDRGDLPYEDDDRLIVLNEFRERLEMMESERIARLPASERPADWTPTRWTSDIKAMSDGELASDLADHRAVVTRLELLDMDTASPKTRREIGRRAYQLRMHYEGVRLLSVVADRTRYQDQPLIERSPFGTTEQGTTRFRRGWFPRSDRRRIRPGG